jgi:uncharacterized repeat protein (TIGR01451 family)
MSRHLPPLLVVWLIVSPAHAQQRFRETPEPPLADEAGAVQPTAAREPRPLTPSVRWSDAPAPVVLLTVRAPSVLPVSREVEVRLVVENVGRVPAKNVAVVYQVPPGAEPVKPPPEAKQVQGGFSWAIPTLAAGERKEFGLTVKPPPGATELENRAQVFLTQEQAARTRFAKPELRLRKTGPEQALFCDILVFGMEVTNTSPVELTDVALTDTLPEGLEHRPDEVKDRPYKGVPGMPAVQEMKDGHARSWKIDRLGPGQARRVEYYVAVVANNAGPIEHKALAQAAGGVSAEASGKVTLGEPKLELKAEAPARQSATMPARARITLTNRSPRVLTNIVVTDQMLDSCKLETVSAGGQTFNNKVQWIVPSLALNEVRALDAVVRRPEGGPVRHQVTAVYRGITRQAAAATEFDAAAALHWDFRGAPATVEVNGEVTYTVTVQNTGAAPAGNVRPAVELPPELRLVKAEPKEHKPEGARVVFDPVTLPPGGRATYLVHAQAVKPSVGARVQAELSADLYASGPVRKQDVTAIGGSSPAPPAPPVGPAPNPAPIPVPPPPPRP